ncbi:hypothetical protein [Flavobacterium humi]|uniref:DUF2157 domain-containing protein n=1 Tax=Flavobacterium humi TaxID=2562683 RepID=A0A4Z0L7S1_9FLAO|nr:hypothetical protein [Flavobacterium humi]TGD58573.1 hypothetical protein E4635_06575 [Flavobacterium humi]
MIAYNKELLDNTFLFNEAQHLKNSGFIPKNQLDGIAAKRPTLKNHQNILVRIGFFLLGSFLYSSIAGVVSLMTLPFLENQYKALVFIYAIIGIVASEFLAVQNFKSHGLDDAFILGAQGCLLGAVGVATEEPAVVFATMAIVGLLSCLRYAHALSALIGCIGIIGFFGNLIVEEKMINMSFLPFVMLLLAFIIYFIYFRLISVSAVYYKNSLLLVQGFALVLAYASMNYLVVRELSVALMDLDLAPGSDIPFAFVFYGFTFLIPLFYIFYSLAKKDKLMLYVGLAALGFSFYTIRYYYSVLPVEIALILGGCLLFAISYFAISRLKNNTSGITFMPDRNENNTVLSNIEVIMANSQVSLKGVSATEQKMPFGGGGFSGGGSGGTY